jgi:agmatine deiminase
MKRNALPRPSETRAPALRRRELLLGGMSLLALTACGGGGADGDGGQATLQARVPAETEPQAAVLLASPTLQFKTGCSSWLTQAQMIRELITTATVVYACNSDADAAAIREALATLGVGAADIAARVDCRIIPHADYWVRDYGGIFMHDGAGGQQVVDFDFDGYGYVRHAGPLTQDVYNFDNEMSVRVADALGKPVSRSALIAEGGNLHFNGRGTVVATELGLLGRNPGWTKAQAEAELKRLFNLKKVIWVPRGLATDAHTVLQTPYQLGGEAVYNVGVNHIDEMLSWVDASTLLLPEVTPADLAEAAARGDPLAQMNHEILAEAEAILRNATDQDGAPLKLVRVPEPGSIVVDITPADGIYGFIADLNAHPQFPLQGAEHFAAGETMKMVLPASYMNFLVVNDVVLVPRFHKAGRDAALQAKDEAFRATIAAHYPGRRVVQIEVDSLVSGGGGMHCITQHIPRPQPLAARA